MCHPGEVVSLKASAAAEPPSSIIVAEPEQATNVTCIRSFLVSLQRLHDVSNVITSLLQEPIAPKFRLLDGIHVPYTVEVDSFKTAVSLPKSSTALEALMLDRLVASHQPVLCQEGNCRFQIVVG